MSEADADLQKSIAQEARASRDELVALVADLIACDTTARVEGDEPREEERLQRILEARLVALGGEVDLWEPGPTGPEAAPRLPAGLDFVGRPQLVACIKGSGGGPSLLLNGHIDVVTAEPVDQWTHDPFSAVVRDGRIYGRGACDMKGGLASMLFALELLHRLGVKLKGDVIYSANTDEESTGAGGHAVVAHGIRADAGICAEPTGFDVWTACRGELFPTITVRGRSGHAELNRTHWQDGGAVNAIQKSLLVLQAIERLREEWQRRADQQHPLLSPGDIVPTMIAGGVWPVTCPPSVAITCDVTYLPGHVDASGTGRAVRDEMARWVDAAAAADPWLAAHPLEWDWGLDIVPAEMAVDHELVGIVLDSVARIGRRGAVAGFDSWHDAATFTQSGTPMFSFGPGGLESAHGVDEYVPVEDLVDHAIAVAAAITAFCGIA